jgi:hypothetical protein
MEESPLRRLQKAAERLIEQRKAKKPDAVLILSIEE